MRLLIITTIILLLTTGCGTVITGFYDEITFTSEPEGSSVYVDHDYVGKTPIAVNIYKELGSSKIEFKMGSCDTNEMVLRRVFNRWSILNLTAWPGWLIDLMTGAIKKPKYTTFHADMECIS